jgi:NADPH2:quinone reductase
MPHAIRVHSTGGPDVLKWEEVEGSEHKDGEVRIRQSAAGLNFIDVYHRNGLYKLPAPFTPGVEGAGTVVAVGPGVDHLKVGDRVAYAGPVGGYAEERLVAADRLVKIPDSISFEQAAGVMLRGMTARMLLRAVFPVQSGDAILVHAAAGGVGLIMCQWANAIGATVIGTVSSEEKAELARAHGCHHPILYTKQDFVAEVKKLTAGEKLPVVYDSVGRTTFAKSLDCLKPRGLMVSFGNSSGPVKPFAPALLAQKGSLFLTRPTLFNYIATRAELEQSASELFEIIDSGKVKVEVNQTFPLKEAAEAHRALESRKTTGSTVLTI